MTATEVGLDGVRVDDGDQELHLRVMLDGKGLPEYERRVGALRDLVLSFPGPCAVIAHVGAFDGRSGRETLMAVGPGYRVAPTGLLFGEIERLLGPDTWRLTPAGSRCRWELLP